jgi:phosphatidate cytidylyltransferase
LTRNTLLRLSVFFLGIPLLVLSAIALPRYGLPFFGLLVIVASAFAAYEAAFFFPPQTRDYPGKEFVIPALGAVLPTVGYLSIHFPTERLGPSMNPGSLLLMTMTIMIAVVMAVQVLKRREREIFEIINVVSTHLFLLVYPGLFTWHVTRIISLPSPSILLIVFVLAVYLNDSMAWVVGRLLGPLTREVGAPPPVAVSPNKSVAGFVGGFLASPIVIIGAGNLFPDLFPGGVIQHLLFGAIIGITGILGDLVESAFKRAATVKDSGQIIPGRGGLLDSIDSPLFAAPFFYYSYVLIFGF